MFVLRPKLQEMSSAQYSACLDKLRSLRGRCSYSQEPRPKGKADPRLPCQEMWLDRTMQFDKSTLQTLYSGRGSRQQNVRWAGGRDDIYVAAWSGRNRSLPGSAATLGKPFVCVRIESRLSWLM